MAWTKTPNVAQYKNADWKNFVQREANCTPEKARRIALINPEITFFFFCREHMVLEGPVYDKFGAFNPGDAVFFSGEPWYGSAPQCDSFRKKGMTVAYINPKDSTQFRNISTYKLKDGSPAIDVVCIFAANYASNVKPYLRAQNNVPPTNKPFNENIQQILSDGSVQYLQDKGIVVLMSILNGHSKVGWSEFTAEKDASDFANYLRDEVINKYNLDGIDIDDEYSSGKANDTSLIMVTSYMRSCMPGKMIITKALWDDYSNFTATWKGQKLAANLTYGCEMSYYQGSANNRLSPYLGMGMTKDKLLLGFSAEDRFKEDWPTVKAATKDTMKQGYEGAMMFDLENQPSSLKVLSDIADGMYGSGGVSKEDGYKK